MNNVLEVAKQTRSLVLLYVEDDSSVAVETVKLLENFFDKIVYAKNGKEGIEKFNENHIDLIITDIQMPELNGLEMLKAIDLLGTNTPVIITTAHNEIEYYKNALNLNVQSYLLKPIKLESIIDIIKKILLEIEEKDQKNNKMNYLIKSNKKLIDIGYQISHQKDYSQLLEEILIGAKELSGADGGTLYIFNAEEKALEFKIFINTSLNVHYCDMDDKVLWKPLKLYNDDNSTNKKNVAVVCAMQDYLININDIYHSVTYDFAGAKHFDKENNYKTTSMLVIPMKNKENDLIGVIQLINKLDDGKITSFNSDDEALITSMSAQATMVLENNHLVIELEKLLYSLVKSIGSALNEKSNYTAKHVSNVERLSEMLIDTININETTFKDISFTSDEIEEMKLAAWLHDIGKITTPEYVVDKATKLETIYDRVQTIEAKFEILKRDIEIIYLKGEITEEERAEKTKQIQEDINFIHTINSGEIFMKKEYIEKLNYIASKYKISVNYKKKSLLTPDELYNLSTTKGTLTKEEREVINNHVIVSYNMLKEVPFPKKFEKVPKIAGSHHKTVDGKGYAAKEIINLEMTIRDKILAVADIFEALSAHDRPYRGPNTLSQIADILVQMVKDEQLDRDIVKLFLEEKLYLQYAKEYLAPTQIDEVDIDFSNF